MSSWLFLIGAPKCGTSSAAAWLDRNETVNLASVKEPCFFTDFAQRTWCGPRVEGFSRPWVGDRAAYEGLFDDSGAAWRVDASTDYLWSPGTADRIAAFRDDGHTVKVAAILRDPIQRAISEHQHLLRDGFTTEKLSSALSQEAARMERQMHPLFYHVTRSRYSEPIARYRALFGDDLAVLDYHRLPEELPRLAAFLGLSERPPEVRETLNKGYVYRHPALRRLIKSEGLLRMARAVIPKQLRQPIRTMTERAAQRDYVATPDEIASLRRLLAADIAACIADPDIPTDAWHLARGDDPALAS